MIFLQVADSIAPSIQPAILEGNLLEKSAGITLEHLNIEEGDLTIILTDDDPMQQLNKEFLDVDAPTDVLSFPADYTDPDSGAPYLGDVLISYPRALEQSSASGHTVGLELQLLVVHGVLHLLGYNDEEAQDKFRMWAVQAEILGRLNNPLSPP